MAKYAQNSFVIADNLFKCVRSVLEGLYENNRSW